MPHFLQDLAVVLAVAAVTTVVSHRLRLPAVVGYIVAGLLTGAANPATLVTDPEAIETLAELGVVLIMFAIGSEFSLRKLFQLVPVVGVVAAVEVGLMLGLGYLAGHLVGWTPRESFFAGGIVAISSTMIVVKAFEDRPPSNRLKDLVLGVLLMEDLVAILLLVLLSTDVGAAGPSELFFPMVRLAGFLAALLAGGMFLIPRAMRAVQKIDRSETTLVAGVAVAFLFAGIAEWAGYSVALGGFVGGALVRESGTALRVSEVVRPVRDLFAAIFFVAVGMLVEPAQILASWPIVLMLVGVVLVGKTLGVTLGGFLAGFGVRISIQGGMTLAQIGEFSFAIAGLGLVTGAAPPALYPVAVAVSVITAVLTPTLVRLSDPISAAVDRRLPHRVQTFICLYGSWIELIRARSKAQSPWTKVRGSLLWMTIDTAAIVGVLAVASLLQGSINTVLRGIGIPVGLLAPALVALAVLAALPFGVGLVASTRRVARQLGEAALPISVTGPDTGGAPRRLLTVALEIVIVLAVGLPVVAVTQPFIPAWPTAIAMSLFLLILAVAFWRSAAELEGHVQAGAQVIVEALARQGADEDGDALHVVEDMLPGLGTLIPYRIGPGCPAVGKSLGELNIRGLTGASVVALVRDGERYVLPDARQGLLAGDVLALSGSHGAIASATRLLRGEPLTGPAASAAVPALTGEGPLEPLELS